MKAHVFSLIAVLLFGFARAQDQLTIEGGLAMHPGSTVAVYGDLVNNGSFSDLGGTTYFAGNGTQVISGSSPIVLSNLVIANSSIVGITLNGGDIIVTSSLILNSGYLNTSTGSRLALGDGTVVTGGSDESFVNGPIIKAGNDAFSFPIGKAGRYVPLSISSPALITDTFMAEYMNDNPIIAYGSSLDTGLHHISPLEYWMLQRTSGASNVNVTLAWDELSSVANISDLRVTSWDGIKWTNLGNGYTSGNSNGGMITASSTGSAYTAFTLGALNDQVPLPVTLLNFSAQLRGSYVELKWVTASELNNDYFTVEKTKKGKEFIEVARVQGAGTSNVLHTYTSADSDPYTGISYYRLKQTDYNGDFEYSNLIPVQFTKVSGAMLKLYPNPARSSFKVEIQGMENEIAHISLVDVIGRLYYFNTVYVDRSRYILSIDENSLPLGTYFVIVSNSKIKETAKLFINH